MPVCKKCGNEYDDSLNACPNCGEPNTPDIPEETFDMYQELLSTSDTKEFVMPSDLLEEIAPSEMLSDPDAGESPVLEESIREQMVREMFAEEPEEPGLMDKLQSSLSSFISSIRKNLFTARAASKSSPSSDENNVSEEDHVEEETYAVPITNDAEAEDAYDDTYDGDSSNEDTIPEAVKSTDSPDTDLSEENEDVTTEEMPYTETVADASLPETSNELDTVYDQPSKPTDDLASFEDDTLPPLFDELSDEPSFEEGLLPSIPDGDLAEADQDNELSDNSVSAEILSEEQEDVSSEAKEEIQDEPEEKALENNEDIEEPTPDITSSIEENSEELIYEETSVDSILEGLRENLDSDIPTEENEQTEVTVSEDEETPVDTTSLATSEESDSIKDASSGNSSDKGSRLLRKKGLGKAAVLGLALLAILSVLGVIFLWILPQKRAEQQAIEERENAYLDFLCDTWMSDVFIYADQAHPSREVLTLNKDYTYRCDIWTSSSDREAFDPEIWSITDTNEGTYYLELDTASLRIYYTGDDGEDYVYRRYIRQLDDDVLVLREYYNETLSEYYDVTFSKYTEGMP